ncbi:MAG TPA: cobalamin-dependent protein, partial [Nitrospira sp.]|nr:cobalamin-dependent protein [Nitrospira sp.]
EFHELGAQAVAYLAAARGCHIYYLGSNLPLTDLQTFCESITPDLVLLSLTESRSAEMARRLLHQLRPIALRWPVAMGGQGAEAFEHLLQHSKVEVLHDLAALHNRLASLLSMHQRAFR